MDCVDDIESVGAGSIDVRASSGRNGVIVSIVEDETVGGLVGHRGLCSFECNDVVTAVRGCVSNITRLEA